MNIYAIRQTRTKIRALAYYQIAGGTLGLVLCTWVLVTSLEITTVSTLVLLLTVSLYSSSVYCGLLLNRGDIIRGLKISLINQALQVIGFGMFGYAYKFIAGISVSLGVNLTDEFLLRTTFSFSEFLIYFNSNEDLVYLNINVVAICLIYLIQKMQIQIEEDSLLKIDSLDDKYQ